MAKNWVSGAYPATEGGGRGGGGGGLGRAVPRCRHIGCVVSHRAAVVLCCVVLRVWHLCHPCWPCHHDMEGGGRGAIGKCAAARAVTWVSSSSIASWGFWSEKRHPEKPPVELTTRVMVDA